VLSGMNIALLVSPFIAGAIYDNAGYYAVFGVVLGVIAIDFVLRVAMIEKRVATKWRDQLRTERKVDDEEEAATFSCATTRIITIPTSASSPSTNLSRSSTIDGDDKQDQTHSEPDENSYLLPKGSDGGKNKPASSSSSSFSSIRSFFKSSSSTLSVLLSSSDLNASIYGGFIHAFLIVGFDAILPLYVIHQYHWKATAGGLIFLALTIPSMLSTVAGSLSDRYGPRLISLVGFAIVTPSLALLGLSSRDDSIASKICLVIFLALVGLGLTLLLTPLAVDVYNKAQVLSRKHPDVFAGRSEADVFALVYALFNSALGVAVMVGPALAGLLYETTGWRITVGILAAVTGLGAGPVWMYTGNKGK
jgi:MFS family permease